MLHSLSLLFRINILILIVSCQNAKLGSTDLSKFVEEISINHKIKYDSPQNIFVLSETGCIGCNKAYLDFIQHNIINKDGCIIYSTASGMRLDISPFLADSIHNYFEGERNSLKEYDLIDGSYYLHINGNHVDTFIHIRIDNIQESINYIISKSIPTN